MKKNKLVKTLNCLSAWELRNLSKFVSSPYFNSRQDVIDFLDYLLEEKKKKYATFEKETAFKYVYPNREFSDKDFRLLCSYLFKLIEEFLTYEEIKKDNLYMNFQLVQTYRNKKINENFFHRIRELNRLIEKQPYRDENYWKLLYQLQYENVEFGVGVTRANTEGMGEVTNFFDIYIIASVLKSYCLLLAQENVSTVTYDKELLNRILEHIDINKRFLEIPAISIYFHFYKAMTTSDESFFEKMRQLIRTHQDKFPLDEIKNIYLLASNYCIKQANGGMSKYFTEYFELNEAGINQGFLLDNGRIDRFLFKNMVVVALRLNNIPQANAFVLNYKSKLEPQYQESLYHFCKGKILHFEGKYAESMRLLAQFISEDPLLILDAKNMLLKMYYETEEYEALGAHLRSFKTFLDRKKQKGLLNETRHDYYRQIVKCGEGLLKMAVTNSVKSDSITKLMKEIDKINFQADADWFRTHVEKV